LGSSRPNKYEKTVTLFDSQAHQLYIGTLKRVFAKLEKKLVLQSQMVYHKYRVAM